MVAGVGIAPTSPAYETGVLLLDHPALLVEMKGLEPPSSPCKSDVLPLNYIPYQEWWSGVESNPHLWFFRPALRPHQLPLHGVSAGNRTLVRRITLSHSAIELHPPWQGHEESNPGCRFWRPMSCH